jgi:hypothetical protein
MITFGGRPLNTYKGGTNTPSKPTVVQVNPVSLTIEPPGFVDPIKHVVQVNPASLTIEPPGFVDPIKHVVQVNPDSLTIEPPGLFDRNKHLVKVDPASLTIEPPNQSTLTDPLELFDQTKSPEIEYPEINKIISGGNSKTLLKLQAALDKAKFNSLFFVKLLGAPIVIFFMILWRLLGYFWKTIIFMIIFSICYYLYEITQGILNVGHSLLDVVSKSLNDMYKNGTINFGFIGFPKAKINLFGYMEPWIRDVDRSNNKFPRKASDLVIYILTEMIKGIVDSLPGIIEGMSKGFVEIFK